MKRTAAVVGSLALIASAIGAVTSSASAAEGDPATVSGNLTGTQVPGYAYWAKATNTDTYEVDAEADVDPSTGAYSLTGLIQGETYAITYVASPTRDTNEEDDFSWEGTSSWEDPAVKITPNAPTAAGPTAQFATISGSVIDGSTSAPRAGQEVNAKLGQDFDSWVKTNASGAFVFPLLPHGTYKVVVGEFDEVWLPASDSGVVAQDTAVTDVLLTQFKGGVLTGRYRLPKGALWGDKQVHVWKGSKILKTVRASSSGAFTARGLPTGAYRVSFARASKVSGLTDAKFAKSAGHFYKRKAESTTLGKANTISVAKASTTKLAADSLVAPVGKASGTLLKRSNKRAAKGYYVYVLDSTYRRSTRAAKVSSRGTYKVYGLTPGTYQVWATPSSGSKPKKLLGKITIRKGKTTKVKTLKY